MSAQVYISGGRLITAGGAVFGIPAAGPPPPPSGEENVVKFRSGMYMQSGNPNDQASMNAFSTSWAGNGGACQGYSAWYKWNLVETALGVYSFTSVFNDYAYLQSVAPGASFVPQFNWYANQMGLTPAELPSFNPSSDGVPNYILDNPSTYGAGPPTSSSSYGGWCCDSYESTAYNYVRAAYWRTLIQARIVALFNAFGSTIVPDGQGFTVDEHPLFEMVGTSTPTDLDMQTAPNIAADYTYELANQAWLNMLPSLRATMPHTGVFLMPGFGPNNFSGGNDPTQQNVLIKSMLTNGIAQSCTDCYLPTALTYAQNYAIGNNYNGSTGFQTPIVGQLDQVPSVQGDDYPLATITQILNTGFVTLQASRMFLYSQSSANFNIPGFWNTIIGTINSYSIPTICGELPTMYMIAPQNFVAASTTASSVTLTWTPQTTQTGTNLVYKIYRNGSLINVTASTSVFTYTDSGLSANTAYTYTINLSNANGVGPQSTYVATTQVFNYTTFPAYPVSSLTTTSTQAGNVVLPGSVLAIINSTGTHQATGAFYNVAQVNIQSFTTQFEFQIVPGSDAINGGITFIVQNATSTTNPLHPGAGFQGDANVSGYGAFAHLGNPSSQQPCLNSIGVTFSCYDYGVGFRNSPNFVALYVNGGPDGTAIPYLDPGAVGINFQSGNTYAVTLVYDGTLLTMVLKDTVTNAQLRVSWPINIPACCQQNIAWVGFGAGSVESPSPVPPWNILNWSYSIGYNPRLATPTLSVGAGSYPSSQSVTISGPSGASIYYSTNGLQPTSSSTLYTGAVTVSANTFLQAIAIQAGYTDSFVVSANYQIQASGPTINLPSGFASASGLILPVGWARLNGSKYQLTDTTAPTSQYPNGESGGIWYVAPVNIATFSGSRAMSATLQFTSALANGMAFVIQNQNQSASTGYVPGAPGSGPSAGYGTGQLAVTGGPMALAFPSNGLGYACSSAPYTGIYGNGFIGLYASVAVVFDVYDGNVTGLYLNGAYPSGSAVSITGITLSNGNPITCALSYDGTTLSMSLTDTVTLGTFSHSWVVNIPSSVGANTAYVGFTAGTGGEGANMFVNNWTGF